MRELQKLLYFIFIIFFIRYCLLLDIYICIGYLFVSPFVCLFILIFTITFNCFSAETFWRPLPVLFPRNKKKTHSSEREKMKWLTHATLIKQPLITINSRQFHWFGCTCVRALHFYSERSQLDCSGHSRKRQIKKIAIGCKHFLKLTYIWAELEWE